MELALSNSGLADVNLAALVARAAECGYRAVELCVPSETPVLQMAGAAEQARSAAEAAGVRLACLALARHPEAAGLDEARRWAAAAGCPWVAVAPPAVARGQNKWTVAGRAAERVRASLDQPAGVGLLMENAPPFASARNIWTVVEMLSHPSVGVLWNASQGGDEPVSVSIPTLAAVMRHVRLGVVGLELPLAPRGPVAGMLNRLRGIGYCGAVALAMPAGASADVMRKARETIELFLNPPPPPKPAKPAKAEATKAAAATA